VTVSALSILLCLATYYLIINMYYFHNIKSVWKRVWKDGKRGKEQDVQPNNFRELNSRMSQRLTANRNLFHIQLCKWFWRWYKRELKGSQKLQGRQKIGDIKQTLHIRILHIQKYGFILLLFIILSSNFATAITF
jgi:hypothetical protein